MGDSDRAVRDVNRGAPVSSRRTVATCIAVLLVYAFANAYTARMHRARDEHERAGWIALVRQANANTRACLDTLVAREAADSADEANGPRVGDTVRVTRPTPLYEWRRQ